VDKIKQMSILMVLETPYPPDERVENEINILTKNGFKITLVCTRKGGTIQVEEKENLTIYRIPISKFIYKSSALALILPFYFHFWYNHLSRIIKKSKFDVIHLHDLPLAKVGLRLSKEFALSLISDHHENRPEIMKMYHHVQSFPGKYLISVKQWIRYQKKFTKKIDRLILVTDEAKDYYINNYGIAPDRITVLPNYIVLERFRLFDIANDSESDLSKKFTIVYFGDTGLRRGTSTILESAAILKENKDIHFLIIGSSREQQQLQSTIDFQELHNVTLTGWIPVAEAIKYINIAKVGLCPFLRNIHHDTTYANKMFQYMALGKPVIVSNCTAQANFVNKEFCGLVFEADNSIDLCNQIIKLTDQSEYDRFSKNAKACVYDKYNWETSGSKLIELYSSLINE
jgi:glycosyltransferase involved in cell wall biosynthesis